MNVLNGVSKKAKKAHRFLFGSDGPYEDTPSTTQSWRLADSLLHQRLIDVDGLLSDVLPAKHFLSALLTRLANLGSAVTVGDHVVDSGSDASFEVLRIGLVVVN